MPLPEALVCPVCLRQFRAKSATLHHVSCMADADHRDAMEWQVELAIDARFKGFSCQEASRVEAIWFGHDWIARIWKAAYGEEATRARHQNFRVEKTREHHRLFPDFNHFSDHRVEARAGRENPFYGKKHSPEARAKMSERQRGKTISEDQIRKFRETHRRNFPTAESFGEEVRKRYQDHPEARAKLREARLRQRFLKVWTKPERVMAALLASTNCEFEDHVAIGGIGVVDFLVGRTIIEVFGDYWHANPSSFDEQGKPLHPRQLQQRAKDEARNDAYQELGYRVEIFWEADLLQNVNECRKRLIEIARSSNA